MSDLTEIITEAVEDASIETTPDVVPEPIVDAAPTDGTPSITESNAPPVEAADAAVQDEFEKRWGIPSRSVTGRENRLPHSRVKTMVTKAEQEALSKATKETEAKFTPRITEFEGKIKNYEERLGRVAQFENILQNDPRTFLQMLSQIPAYSQFFQQINQLASGQPAPQEQPYLAKDGMPQPDETLSDGTRVYSLDGLQKRDEWVAKQIETRVLQQADKRAAERYAPMEQQFQQQQRMAQITPVIEKQIAEARTWPNFNELEPSIVKALRADPNLNLERAYMKAYQDEVIPKFASDRNKIRSEVLAEIKQKPSASAAPTGQVRPTAQGDAPKSTYQVIEDSLKEAGLL